MPLSPLHRPAGLAQALVDPLTRQPDPAEVDPSQFDLDFDPGVRLLLSDPSVDPILKGILRDEETKRINREKLKLKLALEKNERDKENKKFLTFFYGIPTFQLGTAAGLKGAPAFFVDVVVDPLNFIGFGATKLGRAAKRLGGMSVADKIETVKEGANVLARLQANPNRAEKVARLVADRNSPALRKELKALRKEVTPGELSELQKVLGPDDDLVKILRGDKASARDLQAILDVGEAAETNAFLSGRKNFFRRVAAGHSAFVKFQAPLALFEFGSFRASNMLKNLGVKPAGPSAASVARAFDEVEGASFLVRRAQELGFGTAKPFIGRNVSLAPIATQKAIREGLPMDKALELGDKSLNVSIRDVKQVRESLVRKQKDLVSEAAEYTGRSQQEVREAFEATAQVVDQQVRRIKEASKLDRGKFLAEASQEIQRLDQRSLIARFRKKKIAKTAQEVFEENPALLPQAQEFIQTQVADALMDDLLSDLGVMKGSMRRLKGAVEVRDSLGRSVNNAFTSFGVAQREISLLPRGFHQAVAESITNLVPASKSLSSLTDVHKIPKASIVGVLNKAKTLDDIRAGLRGLVLTRVELLENLAKKSGKDVVAATNSLRKTAKQFEDEALNLFDPLFSFKKTRGAIDFESTLLSQVKETHLGVLRKADKVDTAIDLAKATKSVTARETKDAVIRRLVGDSSERAKGFGSRVGKFLDRDKVKAFVARRGGTLANIGDVLDDVVQDPKMLEGLLTPSGKRSLDREVSSVRSILGKVRKGDLVSIGEEGKKVGGKITLAQAARQFENIKKKVIRKLEGRVDDPRFVAAATKVDDLKKIKNSTNEELREALRLFDEADTDAKRFADEMEAFFPTQEQLLKIQKANRINQGEKDRLVGLGRSLEKRLGLPAKKLGQVEKLIRQSRTPAEALDKVDRFVRDQFKQSLKNFDDFKAKNQSKLADRRFLDATPRGGSPLDEVEDALKVADNPAEAAARTVVTPNAENPAIIVGLAKTIDKALDVLTGTTELGLFKEAGLIDNPAAFGTVVAGQINSIEFYKGQVQKSLALALDEDSLIKVSRTIDDPKRFPVANLTEAEAYAHDEVIRLQEGIRDLLIDRGLITHDQVVQHYLTHMVRIKDEGIRDKFYEAFKPRGGNRAGRISKDRVFPTITELKAFIAGSQGALELRTENLADIISSYLGSAGKSLIENDIIVTLGNVTNHKGQRLLYADDTIADGLRQVFRAKKGGDVPKLAAGADVTDYKALRGNPLWEGTHIHDDVFRHMQVVFEPDVFTRIRNRGNKNQWEKIVRGAEYLNSLGKTALFRLSPFHFMSLTLSTLALLPFDEARRTIALAGKESWHAFWSLDPAKAKQRGLEIFTKAMRKLPNSTLEPGLNAEDLLQRYLLSNSKLSSPFNLPDETESLDAFRQALDFAGKRSVPIASAWARGVLHVNDLVDATMWDVYQNGLKFMAWAHIRHRAIKDNPALLKQTMRLFETEREIGNTVGKALGGLSWENFLFHKTTRKFLQFAFIAPDWTMSNLLMARDLFVNNPLVATKVGQKFFPDIIQREPAFRGAAAYNFRGLMYGFLGGNMLNYAFTGKFLWEMDQEAFDQHTGIPRVELPYRDHRGRRQFMDTVRMFSEPWKLLTDPQGFMRAKMGVLPRSLTTLVGVNGFGQPIYGAKDGWMERQMKSFVAAGSQFVPISVQEASRAGATVLGLDETLGIRSRDPRSAVVGSFGFPVRSETQTSVDQSRRIRELEATLGVTK